MRFTSVAAVAGVAVGVAGLLSAIAVSRGIQLEMQRALLAAVPHISVFRADGADVRGWGELSEKLAAITGVKEVNAHVDIPAALISESGTHLGFLQVGEVEPGDRPRLVIGVELAARAELAPGMTATLMTADDSVPVSSEVEIVGLESTGNYEADLRTMTASRADILRLTGQDEFLPESLAVALADPSYPRAASDDVRAAVGDEYRVVDWQEANRPLFSALELERRAAFIILGLIIAIAALNITTTQALLVAERRLDIAVLRTCGARGRDVAAIFLFEGLALGAAGLAMGMVLGAAAIWGANYFSLISLDPEVYSIGQVALVPQVTDAVWIAAAVLILSLAATLYPALSAARMKPMENLRSA